MAPKSSFESDNNGSGNSRIGSFTRKLYRFCWRHRDMIIKLVFWMIRMFYGNDNPEG